MEVLPDIDAVQQGALLAEGFLLEGFGRRSQENGCVVPKNTSQDLRRR